jgi:hypothetical protein
MASLLACGPDPFFKFPRRKSQSIQSTHSIPKARLGAACTVMYGDALKACRNMQSMRIDDAFTARIAWNEKCIHFRSCGLTCNSGVQYLYAVLTE